MKTVYEFTLKGFNGDTDETDHLVKWVQAETEQQARKKVEAQGWKIQRSWGEIDIDYISQGDIDLF